MSNQYLKQKLRDIGYKLAAREEYEQYLNDEYGPKYVPKRSVELSLLRATHRQT